MTPILLCKIMTSILLFNLKVSVIPNGLKKYMSFAINDKLSFIDSFQYLGLMMMFDIYTHTSLLGMQHRVEWLLQAHKFQLGYCYVI